MSVVAMSKKRMAAAGAAVVGIAAPFTLALSAPDALTSYFGLSTAAANKAFDAIMAGTDIASALAMFGGVTAAGGIGLWILKKAIARAGRTAAVA